MIPMIPRSAAVAAACIAIALGLSTRSTRPKRLVHLHRARLLLNAARMDQLRGVSQAGELMPQKSTYFYPKLATGLTINPLS